ncbi:M48 family metallopeptidase [uncultured Flavobacterium sp.]|uniref:M48 family metallopeptidase n=1 Tax=uncultured Flavobacterium sp. TaxID=165435 RepID=UPI0027E0BDDB|nr:M48 family metallopeptidase [uncultured Flavobacterium sp.]
MKKEVQLSKEFKNQAAKSIFAICFFVLTYLIILLLALVLTGLSVAGGFSLIALKPNFLTIALGIGLASLGILIVAFLLKFIFKSHKADRSHLIEIKESQEPELFQMIRDLVLEVGTTFPKKVYLSSEVNAAVFYDSSFWSMFLPIKKNLQIGLGLVNTVTKEELRAILAHEFGHFSQRTMKVGSYVYNVNQVIFNMLYDNESYDNLIQKWASISGYFSIFVILAVKINQGIQWILRKLYGVVNKSYMALSREMEFHADEIAASVTGYEPLKKSLLRMPLADNSFSNVLSYYNTKVSENIMSENIYNDQSSVIHFLAETNNLPFTNGLPDIAIEEQSKFDKSKLGIKDQWASHPSTNDRIERLEKTGFLSPGHADMPANELFKDITALQKQLTNKLFENVSYPEDTMVMSSDQFIEEYKQQVQLNSFAKIYNGYYDNKNPIFDLNGNPAESKIDFNELYSDEKVDLVYSSIALQNDMETLKNIANKSFPIKSFDYDGFRYERKDADSLIEKLKSELDIINARIEKNDSDIYHHFTEIETRLNKPQLLKSIYNDFFTFDKIFDTKYDLYIKLLNGLQFVNVSTPFDQIASNLNCINPIERELKQEIHLLMSDPVLATEITQDIRHSLEEYTSKEWEYFNGANYLDGNLNILYTAMHNYAFLLSRKYFLMKKALLTYQEELMKNHTTPVVTENFA